MATNIAKFKQQRAKELRTNINGLELLGEINKNFRALDQIDEELADAVQDFERNVLDEDTGEIIRIETYKSTTLDKETIAVYHTRQAGRKMQIDAQMRLLNKVLPDLKAVENTSNLNDKAAQALKAFAAAAAED